MRLFRNPEARLVLYIGVPLAAVSCFLIGFFSRKNIFVVAAAVIGFVLMLVLFFLVLKQHFLKVADFRKKVEKNTSGHKDLRFNDFEEGEFAILQDEIQTMVVAHFCRQEELQEEREKLSHALDDIMHQIRTPLFAITSTAQRMLEQPMEPLEQKLYAQRIMNRTEQIERFVKMLLNMSRMDAGVMEFHRETMTARELISAACDPLETWTEINEISLIRQVPEDISLEGDPVWLAEALTNILKNCMEHTPVGGSISVRVSDSPVYTEIVIRDTGIGIAEEDLPHIFERFYKGRDAHSNSIGIGLAFSKMVIQELDGTIKAENHPDGGAMFTVRLMKSNI